MTLAYYEGQPAPGESAVVDLLREWAKSRGYEVAWGALAEMGRARAEITGRHGRGEVQDGLWERELAPVMAGEVCAAGPTVIVVAVPRPAHRVGFETAEGCVEALLPPTYVRYRATFEDVRQDLATHGLPGARVEHLEGPVKNLAARLGLVAYGRNNVTYVPGLGSFVQLCPFTTDAVLPATRASAPSLLPECDACGACVGACPTAAIDPDRVLLRAERCLTFANENEGEWPSFVDASAHHCLLGCLRCQEICPVNPDLRVESTGLVFSPEETRALLDGDTAGGGGAGPAAGAANGVRLKLAWLGQPYAEPVLGRNLRALIDARRG